MPAGTCNDWDKRERELVKQVIRVTFFPVGAATQQGTDIALDFEATSPTAPWYTQPFDPHQAGYDLAPAFYEDLK